MRNIGIIILVVCLCFPFRGNAQEEIVEVNEAIPDTVMVSAPDTTIVMASDSTVQTVLKQAENEAKSMKPVKMDFKPDPNKAIILALIPGMGQIYNRKYWKLPLVYGGFMGCTYAISWNNRNYQDYWKGYQAFVKDEAEKDNPGKTWDPAWTDLLQAGRNPDEVINDTNFRDQLKRKKDYFRRYRDLSIIIMGGVYLLSIVDAYVDAHLFDFDVSPDLSMRVEPMVSPRTSFSSEVYGLNCSIKF